LHEGERARETSVVCREERRGEERKERIAKNEVTPAFFRCASKQQIQILKTSENHNQIRTIHVYNPTDLISKSHNQIRTILPNPRPLVPIPTKNSPAKEAHLETKLLSRL
jgi:hypothetical protein